MPLLLPSGSEVEGGKISGNNNDGGVAIQGKRVELERSALIAYQTCLCML